ncbi:MAG: hemerythrin domain-containing protein [Thermoanaerobaculia bacterium]
MNPIEMLKNDHKNVKAMLDEMEKRDADQRKELLADLERDLEIHTQLEEEIVYPAFRDASTRVIERRLYFEATEEHHVVDMVLPELKMVSADNERFAARVKVVRELLDHHIEEEENEMLPKMYEMLGEARLQEMGRRMVERRTELEREWASTLGKAKHKAKSVAEKFMPASAKDLRDRR